MQFEYPLSFLLDEIFKNGQEYFAKIHVLVNDSPFIRKGVNKPRV